MFSCDHQVSLAFQQSVAHAVYHMRDVRCIRRHLDLDSAKLLATALASSRLDYCNSLLNGIADIDLTRLQCFQNRLVHPAKSPPCTRSIPLLRSLHWLPVRFRMLFRINSLAYKTLRQKQPVYQSINQTSIASISPAIDCATKRLQMRRMKRAVLEVPQSISSNT